MRKPDWDLRLEETAASRFLLWLSAGLIFLTVLAFAAAAIADAQLTALQREPRIISVALPPSPEPIVAREEVSRVLDYLRTLPGVAYASLINEEEFDQLVDGWLGGSAGGLAGDDLLSTHIPLPRLIDVAWNPGVRLDLGALDEALGELVPGATIGDSGQADDRWAHAARLVRGLAGALGLALLALSAGVAAWATRASLELHRRTIEVLRQMGASDALLARQLEQQALARGLRGALAGFAAAVCVVVACVFGPAWLGSPPLLAGGPAPLHWILLATVPVISALLTALAARLTARSLLLRWR